MAVAWLHWGIGKVRAMPHASILDEPHPSLHIVYPCRDHERIPVSAFALTDLSKAESVILITTRGHGEAIFERQASLNGWATDHSRS
jgi:hypothetical protein